MAFLGGLLLWLAIGVIAGWIVTRSYKAAATVPLLTAVFGVLGAFIGGMLGNSVYIFHDPHPLRLGGIIGALFGAAFFSALYHFIARKVI